MKRDFFSVFIRSFYFNPGFFNAGIYNFQLPLKKGVKISGDGFGGCAQSLSKQAEDLAMDMALPFEMHFYKCSWLLAGSRWQ